MARRRLEPLRALIPPESFYDLQLAVTELVSNAVLHAGLSPEQEIRVSVRRRGGCTRVEVEDHGGGFADAQARLPTGRGGRGLMIVEALSARWGIERGVSTVVWCELEDAAPEAGGGLVGVAPAGRAPVSAGG